MLNFITFLKEQSDDKKSPFGKSKDDDTDSPKDAKKASPFGKSKDPAAKSKPKKPAPKKADSEREDQGGVKVVINPEIADAKANRLVETAAGEHKLRWAPGLFGKTDAHCSCGADCPSKNPEAIREWFENHLKSL